MTFSMTDLATVTIVVLVAIAIFLIQQGLQTKVL